MTGEPGGGRRAGLVATLALVAAMLIGGAAGFAVGRRAQVRGPGPDVTLLGLSRGAVLDSLGVTAEQRAEIERLLAATSARAEARVRGMMDDIRTMTNETRRAVRAVLNEAQRERFDALLAATGPIRMRTPVPPGGRQPGPPPGDSSPMRRSAPQ